MTKIEKLKNKILQEMEDKYNELVKLPPDGILEQCHIYSKMQDIQEVILNPENFTTVNGAGDVITEETIDALLQTDDVLMKIIENYFAEYEDMRVYIPAINTSVREIEHKSISISGAVPSWVNTIKPITKEEQNDGTTET